MAKSLKDRLMPASSKALFVVLVMMLNVSFSTLSNAVAYAAEDTTTVETEEEVSELSEVDEEETDEEIAAQEETEEDESDTKEEAVEEEQETESADVSALSAEVTANSEESDEDENDDVDEIEFDAEFDCWTRVSLLEYEFTVTYEASADITLTAGEEGNTTDPSEYESIVPEEFLAENTSITVSGWDGAEFEWTIHEEEIDVEAEERDRCEMPTVADQVVATADLATLETAVLALADSEQCDGIEDLFDADGGPVTVFAPRNSAFGALVAASGSADAELEQLLGNLDELCALVLSHVVEGEFTSEDVPSGGVTLPALGNDLDGIFVQRIGDNVYVDGAQVTTANLFGSNGIVHVIDTILLPQSVGTINPILTDMTAPEITGELSDGDCVLVRIDGTPYSAVVDGSSWSIPEGTVMLNPTKANTLFDVVVRDGGSDCEWLENSPITYGDDLEGLTMRNDVLSYLEPEVEDEDEGEVLGEQTPETTPVETEQPVVVAGYASYGKGGEFAQADNSDEIDTDGDGVPDSEDPDPNDPNVTGLEDDTTSDDENDDQASDDDGENVALWFIAGGGVVLVWYLLWQRSGREV